MEMLGGQLGKLVHPNDHVNMHKLAHTPLHRPYV
jgi:hypothetical protein